MSDPVVTPPTGLLARLRYDVAERLKTIEAFAGPVVVPVEVADVSDVLNLLNVTLAKAGAGGLCVLVSVAGFEPGTNGPRSRRVKVSVQFAENPLLNYATTGANLAAVDAALWAETKLSFNDELAHGWTPSAVWSRLEFKGNSQLVISPGKNLYESVYETQITLALAAPA